MMIDRSNCAATEHGTINAYRHRKCRCPDATALNTRYCKMWRLGMIEPVWVDSIGVARRRQALAAIGYGLAELAPYFGFAPRSLADHTTRRRIHRDKVQRWREVYDLLSMTPGPNDITRRRALKRGWAPPLAWDDIDDPNETPDLGVKRARVRGDVASEARHLFGFGMSEPAVAKQLEVSVPYLRQLLGGGKRAAA